MNKIYLNDLLNFREYKNVKIKFNQWNHYDDPMDKYKENPDVVNEEWLFWRRKKKYFRIGEIAICMLKLSNDNWLLTTIKKVTKDRNIYEGINYEGKELKEYAKYYGRVIVKYHKKNRSQVMYYGNIAKDMEVQQILPTMFDGDEFPGYDQVRLSFSELETILKRAKTDWIGALENQKAVYLISDKSNGKLYVGSATSDNGMLLQRWKDYINNGHGGNTELKKIVNKKGIDYIKKNFQYSILENYNAKIDDNIILKREAWWKKTLLTRDFGYNQN